MDELFFVPSGLLLFDFSRASHDFGPDCQIGVKRAYAKYAQVRVTSGMTGADAAMNVLRHYGLMDVRIERIAGNLTDHYDPRANVIRLSDGVYGSASVAAIGVACHEAGHAVQHAKGYLPIKIRNAILPFATLAQSLVSRSR